jgi:hypothetical protein
MKTTTSLLLLLSVLVVSSCQGGDEGTEPTDGAAILQVVNNSGGDIDHVDVGSVTFRNPLSECEGTGCSTPFFDVSEGSHPVTVYQTATSPPDSLGSIGGFVAGRQYALNIRSISGSYCAELWNRPRNTNGPVFNDDTTRVLVSSSCS